MDIISVAFQISRKTSDWIKQYRLRKKKLLIVVPDPIKENVINFIRQQSDTILVVDIDKDYRKHLLDSVPDNRVAKIEELLNESPISVITLLKRKFALWIFNNFADVSSKIVYVSSNPSSINIIKNKRKRLVFIPSKGYSSELHIDEKYASTVKDYSGVIEFSSVANVNDLIGSKL